MFCAYCREYVRLSVLHVQHRRRRLIVWHGRHGQHMTSRRHEVVVAASLHNVGGRSPIDLKIDSQIPSKVRGPQNNKTSTRLSDGSFGGRARLCRTHASCRRRCFRCSGSGQWRDLVDLMFARLCGVLCKISSGLAKCLPHAMKNPEPSASALRPESAARASAVDRLAHMPHQPRGPFPEVCATFHSRGRKAA